MERVGKAPNTDAYLYVAVVLLVPRIAQPYVRVDGGVRGCGMGA
jgi:hypothetical protein